MSLSCGIVGLPNVGKSTLFNALTRSASAAAENYPFCTIEPNLGEAPVPDPRLAPLAHAANCKNIIPATARFTDIAGLVRGAAKGEGLGNQFLSHIREVEAIIHLVRGFADDNVPHVEGGVNPVRDVELIETELMLADMQSLEKRLPAWQKKAKQSGEEAKSMCAAGEAALALLQQGSPISAALAGGQIAASPDLAAWQLLTAKPVLFVCNVEEEAAAQGNEVSARLKSFLGARPLLLIAAAAEEAMAGFAPEEQQDYLNSMGLQESGLARLVRAAYGLLGRISFFTAGEKETRAWELAKGANAVEAAGRIHTDFAKGFIRAEVAGADDYIAAEGEAGLRAQGKLRLEGRDYIVQDGDVIHFRFNV